MKLTSKGAKPENITRVIQTIGAYVNMLRKEGPQDWVFEELKTQSELSFKYQDSVGGVSKAINMANLHTDYKNPQNILYCSYDFSHYDKQMITSIINELTLDRAFVFFVSDELQNTETFTVDPIYKTKYLAENIRSELIQAQELRPQTSRHPAEAHTSPRHRRVCHLALARQQVLAAEVCLQHPHPRRPRSRLLESRGCSLTQCVERALQRQDQESELHG